MIPQLKSKADFKDFYTEYFSIMVNFAFSKTKDWELSREIVQNTFVKLWTRRKDTEIKSSLKSYLFMMVRNAIIDHYRYNERFADTEQLPERASDDSNDRQEEDLIIIRHAIKMALSQMKEQRRKIFELSKFEGLTYAEIANYLNISERTVEDNMAKALVKIREVIKSYDIEG
jgi:RNA polymerase sigma-70 factor (ECF subfamily)